MLFEDHQDLNMNVLALYYRQQIFLLKWRNGISDTYLQDQGLSWRRPPCTSAPASSRDRLRCSTSHLSSDLCDLFQHTLTAFVRQHESNPLRKQSLLNDPF